MTVERARSAAAAVVDPEIPVVTIQDLGVLRSVEEEEGKVVVTITPTYSGCPAMRQIEADIASGLARAGIDDFEVRVTYSPAWSTDWISDEARGKLADFGIAPPTAPSEVVCPNCASPHPRMMASFGSTACQALMVCSACGEPFHYFKELP